MALLVHCAGLLPTLGKSEPRADLIKAKFRFLGAGLPSLLDSWLREFLAAADT